MFRTENWLKTGVILLAHEVAMCKDVYLKVAEADNSTDWCFESPFFFFFFTRVQTWTVIEPTFWKKRADIPGVLIKKWAPLILTQLSVPRLERYGWQLIRGWQNASASCSWALYPGPSNVVPHNSRAVDTCVAPLATPVQTENRVSTLDLWRSLWGPPEKPISINATFVNVSLIVRATLEFCTKRNSHSFE